MKYTLIVSNYALLDIEDAIYWYSIQQNGFGEKLRTSLFDSLLAIESNPLHFAKRYKDVRVRYIRRFPYGIHYLVSENQIKVIAFFHMKRDPKKWDERLHDK